MQVRAPDGRTATVVEVRCRACRDRSLDRTPGLLGLVQFRHVEQDAVVAVTRRGWRPDPSVARGRAQFRRVDGFAQLECPSCRARPRSHADRLERLATAEVERHGDRVYV